MPKTNKKTAFSLQGFDAASYKQTEAYTRAIDLLYNNAVNEYAALAGKVKLNPNRVFSFDDYPQTKAKAQQIAVKLSSGIKAVIKEGSRNQWLYACKKNDEFLAHILDTSKVAKKTLEKYQDKNLDALSAFQDRKVNGLDLSGRIWNYTGQMKTQMELGIDIGLGDGKSAQELSRDLRQYLVDPDKLFRRVRDKHGNLVLSKNAKAFNPGQGKYRSSYKNAMRLTRSEINMAYRESDHIRWKSLDFVVGFEVKTSNNHPIVDICDSLKGKYPKTFKFVGWHPQCRCNAVPILMDRAEFNTDELNELKAAINGTEYRALEASNKVYDLPEGFKTWASDNLERSKGWKSQPYFIRDNFEGGTLNGAFKSSGKTIPAPIVKVAEKPVKVVSAKIPNELREGSEYLKGEDITFKNEFFDLLDESKTVNLRIEKKGKAGSYFLPGQNLVNISDDSRSRSSKWHKEIVVYHEYGHAIDHQRGLRKSAELTNLMDSCNTKLKVKTTYSTYSRTYDHENRRFTYTRVRLVSNRIGEACNRLENLSAKIARMPESTFTKRGITKADVTEQICSTMDTMKAINIKYGYGHTTAYFKRPGMKEAEFIAHAFENAFAGNSVFKKYLPDIYEDMIRYIKSLK